MAPQLIGSEKQVEWAGDILVRFFNNTEAAIGFFEEECQKAQEKIAEKKAQGKRYSSSQRKAERYESYVSYLKTIREHTQNAEINAGDVIDMRATLDRAFNKDFDLHAWVLRFEHWAYIQKIDVSKP